MQPLLVAFVNQHSGRFRRNPKLLAKVEAVCAGRVDLLAIDTEEALLAAVRGLPLGPNLELGILGGDGTHMRVMSALYEVRGPSQLPLLVSIPFGTVNTIHRRWSPRRSAFDVLAEWLRRDPMMLRRQPTLSVTLDEKQTFIGCTVGAGLVANFFEQYELIGGGPAAALRIAVQSFFGSFVSSEFSKTIMRPAHCQLTIEGKPVEPRRFSLIVSSVFKNVGLGIKVTYRAGYVEDRIALVASTLPASKLGPQFWRVLSGRALKDPEGIDCLTSEWSLTFDDHGPLIIDGDRFNVKNAKVRPGPVWSVLTPI